MKINMNNFNPDNFKNTVNPYRLSKSDQMKVMENINDDRLTNPDGDYFRLKMGNSLIDIPKLRRVSIKTKNGRIRSIPVINYILQQLRE